MDSLPSLKDIAQAAGVSIGTVSQALRNAGGTAQATREKIQKLAEEMGYRPNPVLAGLAAHKFRDVSKHLNPIVYVTNTESIYHGNKLRFHDSLMTRFEELGYSFRHCNVQSAKELRQLARQWYHQGVLGIIFSSFDELEWIKSVNWDKFSLIMLGGRLKTPFVHTVLMDVVREMELNLDKAMQTNARRVGVVLHRHTHAVQDDLLREGTLRVYLDGPFKDRMTAPLFGRFNDDYNLQQTTFDSWVREQQPDLIISHSLILHLRENSGSPLIQNIRHFMLSQDRPSACSGTLAPNNEMASRAAELLDTMIRHRERGFPDKPMTISITADWHEATQ